MRNSVKYLYTVREWRGGNRLSLHALYALQKLLCSIVLAKTTLCGKLRQLNMNKCTAVHACTLLYTFSVCILVSLRLMHDLVERYLHLNIDVIISRGFHRVHDCHTTMF